ncbi:Urb2/Npa2 family-domain-containing protein [Lentinula raphanica]|nr:Urb2/Npa2 family-domain-containing protein [Lentinula raphanica]
MDLFLSSSQNFVKALKASSDPPSVGSFSKLEIARAAWDQKTFYAPRKAEVIVDFILNRFVKSNETQSITDIATWTLLLDVITTSPSTKSDPWLAPLVSRVPFTRIVIQLFESLQHSPHDDHSQLTRIAHECLTISWPYCVPKINTDLLLDCFGACLRLCACYETLDEHLDSIVVMIATSFDRSFTASTSKKKTFASFTRNHLENWLLSLNRLQSHSTHSTLFECLYTPGVQCLLDVDVLRDSETENTISNAFSNVTPEIIMPTLPKIFSTYIQTLRKHRSTMFGQTSSQKADSDGYREASLRLFSLCQRILSKATEKDHSWTTKALLIDVLNQEHIFNGQDHETENLLNGIVKSILVELASVNEGTSKIPPIPVLFDYRFVQNVLSDVLAHLLMVPNTVAPALEILDILLQYHVKTRTVPLYIETLISIDFRETPRSHDFQEDYEQIRHSACLHPRHLDRLAKSVHEFLPLNQTPTVIRNVTERFRNLWEEYRSYSHSSSSDKENPRKRRKIDRGSIDADVTKGLTLSFSTTAIFASVVLSSFSAESVPEETRQELETHLNDFSTNVVLHSLSKMLKKMLKNLNKKTLNSLEDEVALLASLCLRYGLGLQRSSSISIDVGCSPELVSQLSKAVDAVSLPESKLEILRTLLDTSVSIQRQTVLDITLKVMETSEELHVFHMIIHRWLPLIDSGASLEHREQFVALLLELRNRSRVNPASEILLRQTLASAEFWELPRIRDALLALIERSTSAVSDWATTTPQQKQLVESVYEFLLSTPTDYLPRKLRLLLSRRAVLLDQTVDSISPHFLRALRVCISRFISSTDLSDELLGDLGVYLRHLHTGRPSAETLELIQLLFKNLLKNNTLDEILHLVQRYSESLQQDDSSSHSALARSFGIIVDLLLKEFPLDHFSASTQDTFRTLHSSLHHYLYPRLLDTPGTLKVPEVKGLLEDWQQALRLGRWLGLTDVAILGEEVTNFFKSTKPTGDEVTNPAVFGVLVEEFYFCPPTLQPERLELVIAAYVLLSGRITVGGLDGADQPISSLCSTVSPEIYSHGLDFIVSSLKYVKDEAEAGALLHLLSILLQDPPQNTFHIVQNTITGSINIFNDRELFVKAIRLPALLLLLQRSQDRPATLRQVDISGIWLFMAKLCTSSHTHEPNTCRETFHHIVAIATALIRLRRDLILPTIPHLGIILRLLIRSMQSPRSNLGPKQSAMVSSRLPSWINIQDTLGIEEGKSLSRLLESLNTKTVIRRLTTSAAAPPRAESLAKPFSKHAAYVIKAYVESLNDPLCMIPAAVRKELQSGLYALCGMINNFSRDALMASAADAGEKLILKNLWKEYEKQRYVGKG